MDASADEVMDIAREGHRAYERGDYDEARRLFRIAADRGNIRAQCLLGVIYAEGRGVGRDYDKACCLYRLAAGQGDARAQNNLGVMYAEGHGVGQD